MKFSIHALTLIVLLMAAATTLTGCMPSTGQTSKSVKRQHIDAIKQNTLMIQNDLDAIFMIDRPSRLTSYTVR